MRGEKRVDGETVAEEKSEAFVVLLGIVRSSTYNDDGSVIESAILNPE